MDITAGKKKNANPGAVIPGDLFNKIQQLILEALFYKTGWDFRGYHAGAIKRRLVQMRSIYGMSCISEMIPLILHNNSFANEVAHKMLLHVTHLFRDPAFWLSLQSRVFPFLHTYQNPGIWLAGCASGEEVYSLAILLNEHKLLNRTRLYATDLSSDMLALAKKGEFLTETVRESTGNYFHAGGKGSFSDYYKVHDGKIVLPQSLLAGCLFSVHDLVHDHVFSSVHLVICRNVLIYFGKTLRNRVLKLITQTLLPGGFLCLGSSESVQFSEVESLFRVIDEQNRIYQLR